MKKIFLLPLIGLLLLSACTLNEKEREESTSNDQSMNEERLDENEEKQDESSEVPDEHDIDPIEVYQVFSDYELDHGDQIEGIFFSYDEQQTETEITIEGQSYNVYPVKAHEKTLYFKKGKGLWVKEYQDEMTKEMYDEEVKAIRIFNKD